MKRSAHTAVLIAATVLAGGVCFAEALTRIVAPIVGPMIHGVASLEHWRATGLSLGNSTALRGLCIQLSSVIPDFARGPNDGAMVIATVTSGAGMQIMVAFWTILLAMPAAHWRARVKSVATGIPISIGLVAIAATCQLLAPCYAAAAAIAGRASSVTLWEHASNVLESGGRVVISVAVALGLAVVMRWGSARPLSVRLAPGNTARFRSR